MPDLSVWASPGPYHIISYGTLLGSEIFQSFIGGIVAYKTLPRPQFASLQSGLFPIYFAMQSALPAVLALTFPGVSSAIGRGPGSLAGVFAAENRFSVLLPLGTILISGLANALVLGPATTRTMRERKHQETKDGKKSYDPAPHSAEMQRLNKKFGKLHGISSLINMAALIATMGYAATIAELL